MIAVIGTFRIPPDRHAEAMPLMQAVIAATLAEDGCMAYSYARDVTEPDLFRVFETWRSRDALTAHFATDHMRLWASQREQLGFHDRRIHAHQLGPGEAV
jgi:quinol monooxygenase YgiN